MDLHPDLYKHRFYERTTALDTSTLDNGSTFDVTYYQNGNWIKARFRKEEDFKMVNQLDDNGNPVLGTNDMEIKVKKFFAIFFKIDSRILSEDESYHLEFEFLPVMNNEIERLLTPPPDDIYEASMQFEAAWKNNTLKNIDKASIETIFSQHIHKSFLVDEQRTIRRIVTASIWRNAPEDERQHYLNNF